MRDLDPDTYSGTEDLLLEVGSVSVAKELGLALDSYWTAKFTLSKEAANDDVFRKPVDAARLYDDRKPQELGSVSYTHLLMIRWIPYILRADLDIISTRRRR